MEEKLDNIMRMLKIIESELQQMKKEQSEGQSECSEKDLKWLQDKANIDTINHYNERGEEKMNKSSNNEFNSTLEEAVKNEEFAGFCTEIIDIEGADELRELTRQFSLIRYKLNNFIIKPITISHDEEEGFYVNNMQVKNIDKLRALVEQLNTTVDKMSKLKLKLKTTSSYKHKT